MQYLEEALAHRGIVFSGVMLLAALSTYGILPSLGASMAMAFLVIGRFQKDYIYVVALALCSVIVSILSGSFSTGCSMQFIFFIIVSYVYLYTLQWILCVQLFSIIACAILLLFLHLDPGVVLIFMKDIKLSMSLPIVLLISITELQVFSLFFVHIVVQNLDQMQHIAEAIHKDVLPDSLHIVYSLTCLGVMAIYYVMDISITMMTPLLMPYIYVGYVRVWDFFMYVIPRSWSSLHKKIFYYSLMLMFATNEILFLVAMVIWSLVGICKSYGNHWMYMRAFMKKRSGERTIKFVMKK